MARLYVYQQKAWHHLKAEALCFAMIPWVTFQGHASWSTTVLKLWCKNAVGSFSCWRKSAQIHVFFSWILFLDFIPWPSTCPPPLTKHSWNRRRISPTAVSRYVDLVPNCPPHVNSVTQIMQVVWRDAENFVLQMTPQKEVAGGEVWWPWGNSTGWFKAITRSWKSSMPVLWSAALDCCKICCLFRSMIEFSDDVARFVE